MINDNFYYYIKKQSHGNGLLNNYTIDELKNKFVVSQEYESKSFRYKVFDDVYDFKTYFNNLNKKDKTFNEVIFENQNQKLRFDIDVYNDIMDTKKVCEGIHRIVEHLKAIFQKMRLNLDPEKDIILLGSVGKKGERWKNSFHIIIDNYCVDNNKLSKDIYSLLHKSLECNFENYGQYDKQFQQMLDGNIYHTIQLFRMDQNYKFDDERVLEIISKKIEFERSCITFTKRCKDISQNIEYYLLEDEPEPKKKTTKKSNRQDLTKDEIDQLLSCINESRFGSYHPWIDIGFSLYSINNDYIDIWKKYSKKHCGNNYDEAEIEKKWDSFNQKESNLGLILAFAKEDNEDLFNSIIKKKNKKSQMKNIVYENLEFDEYNNIIEYTEEENSNIYSEKKMEDIPDIEQKIILLKANMKMGKTKIIKKYMEKYKYQTILFISSRRSFTKECKSKFGFDSYLDEDLQKKQIIDSDKLIIQVESLYKINRTKKWDLIILDESESIIQQFSSPFIKENRDSVAQILKYLIINSNKTICMDANLSNLTYQIMLNIIENKNEIYYIENNYKNYSNDKHFYTNDFITLTDNLVEKLKQKKKIIICSNSLKKLKIMHKIIQDYDSKLKTELYSSESISENHHHLNDIEKYWDGLDIVLYSPTITSGISYENKRFHCCFAYFSNNSCSVQISRQMLQRCRNFNDNDYYICLKQNDCNQKITDYDDMCLFLDNSIKSVMELSFTCDNAGKLNYEKNLYYEIYIRNKIQNNQSYNNFVKQFIYEEKLTGVQINTLIRTKQHNNEQSILEIANKIEEDTINDIIQARDISDFVDENKNDDLSEFTGAEKNKYQLKQLYNLKNDFEFTYDFIETYNKQDTKEKYMNRINYKNKVNNYRNRFLENGNLECALSFNKHQISQKVMEILDIDTFNSDIKINKTDLKIKIEKIKTYITEYITKNKNKSITLVQEIFGNRKRDKMLFENISSWDFRTSIININNKFLNMYDIKLINTDKHNRNPIYILEKSDLFDCEKNKYNITTIYEEKENINFDNEIMFSEIDGLIY